MDVTGECQILCDVEQNEIFPKSKSWGLSCALTFNYGHVTSPDQKLKLKELGEFVVKLKYTLNWLF